MARGVLIEKRFSVHRRSWCGSVEIDELNGVSPFLSFVPPVPPSPSVPPLSVCAPSSPFVPLSLAVPLRPPPAAPTRRLPLPCRAAASASFRFVSLRLATLIYFDCVGSGLLY